MSSFTCEFLEVNWDNVDWVAHEGWYFLKLQVKTREEQETLCKLVKNVQWRL